ncbi:MAG: beta-propeller repeat protein [Caulobacter sp.]|nr:beta-propeller repeat protein [Caulobacter sp.]
MIVSDGRATRVALFRALGVCALGGLALWGCEKKPAAPPAAAAAAQPYHVYVTNEGSGDLSVIDPVTRQVVASAPLGKRPRGIQLSVDGKALFIALTGSPVSPPGTDESALPPPDRAADGVAVFDPAGRRLVRIIRDVSDPEQLAVGPDGKLYTGSEAANAILVDINGKPSQIAIDGEPEGVAVSPDGATLMAVLQEDNLVVVVDLATLKVRARTPVGERPRSVVFSPDGAQAYVSVEGAGTVAFINVADGAVRNTVRIPGEGQKPMGLAVSKDGATLYVTTGRGGALAAVDARSGAFKGAVKVGYRPWGVALSPDGQYAFTANGPSNDVAMVDLKTLTVAATIKAGERPWGVAVGP